MIFDFVSNQIVTGDTRMYDFELPKDPSVVVNTFARGSIINGLKDHEYRGDKLEKFNGSVIVSVSDSSSASCRPGQSYEQFIQAARDADRAVHVHVKSRVQHCEVHFEFDDDVRYVEMDGLYKIHTGRKELTGQPFEYIEYKGRSDAGPQIYFVRGQKERGVEFDSE